MVAVAFSPRLKPDLLGRKQGLASLLNQGLADRQTLNSETRRTGGQCVGREDAFLNFPVSGVFSMGFELGFLKRYLTLS